MHTNNVCSTPAPVPSRQPFGKFDAGTVLLILLLLATSLIAQAASGANKFLGNITTRGQVRNDFLTYWNHLTGENECKWAAVEGTRNTMNWTGADRIATFAREKKISWTFNSLLCSGSYSSWISNIPDSTRLKEIGEWMDNAAAHYPDVPIIDVIDEGHPTHLFPGIFRTALGGNGTTGFDWAVTAFKMARQRWPNAILVYNDYNNIEYEEEITWTINLITALKSASAPIDAIGCKAFDAWKLPTDKVKKNIDRLAATGLPILISAYEIDVSNNARQDSIMREQFTMFWNHPKIAGITYWGYVVGNTWRANTGLLTQENVERPSLTWLVDYVKNNPNPPNDFPKLLTIGTATVDVRKGSDVLQPRRSIFGNELVAPRVFDLMGRSINFSHGNSHVVPFPSSKRSPGIYMATIRTTRGTTTVAPFVISGK